MVELVESNDQVLISFAASILADAKIEHSVADAHMDTIDGSIGAIATRILVAEGQLTEARELLTEAGVQLDTS
jgi:hypothetical protein